MYFRWNLSRNQFPCFLLTACSLYLYHSLHLPMASSTTQASKLEIWELSLNFQFPLPSTNNLRWGSPNKTLFLKFIFSSPFLWLLHIFHHLFPRLFEVLWHLIEWNFQKIISSTFLTHVQLVCAFFFFYQYSNFQTYLFAY